MVGVYRDALNVDRHRDTLVVNGWIGESVGRVNSVFAGVHVAINTPAIYRWIKMATMATSLSAGARDPRTALEMKSYHVNHDLIGCATLTLPRYTGERVGEATIDVKGHSAMTQDIPLDLSWADQWTLAKERLDRLRTCRLVRTTRLHIILPCLAFGTPVVAPAPIDVMSKWRFSLLDWLGFKYDDANVIDVRIIANVYRTWLKHALGVDLVERDLIECQLPSVTSDVISHQPFANQESHRP